jgi:hypothetical protein
MNVPSFDSAMQSQIDRLVANELSETDRAKLLEWLDQDCVRWRRCALAFLEAQMWEQAAAGDSRLHAPSRIAATRTCREMATHIFQPHWPRR